LLTAFLGLREARRAAAQAQTAQEVSHE